ncbi:MAG: rRNA pseudouridine synthase [Cardiobacteriaceae bacterium]|nr:rRNA pseudouridine synthase [Cardiobacteriaceae bacterium]
MSRNSSSRGNNFSGFARRKKSPTNNRKNNTNIAVSNQNKTRRRAEDSIKIRRGEENAIILKWNDYNRNINTNQHIKQVEEGVRLHKFLADLGYGSRREIEAKILAGRIKIAGRVATIGEKVTGREKITIDSKPIFRHRQNTNNATKVLIYHKPVGVICSRNDPENRPTVFDNLPKLRGRRWIAIGRLDFNTSGLLLFTDNGELANDLMHPKNEIERQYWVRVQGKITANALEKLLSGVELEDGVARFEQIVSLKNLQTEDDEEDVQNRYFSVSLREGKKREVRRLWEAVGCQVSRLKRIKFANIELPRALSPGKSRLATAQEISGLYKLLKS